MNRGFERLMLISLLFCVTPLSCANEMEPSKSQESTSQSVSNDRIIQAPDQYLQGARQDEVNLRKIRVLHISDTHDTFAKHPLPEADILIHSGDFTNEGTEPEFRKFLAHMQAHKHKFKHMVIICGNHEKGWDQLTYTQIQERFGADFVFLQDTAVNIEGLWIYGAAWTDYGEGWAWGNKSNWPSLGKSLGERWQPILPATDILVTHNPPKGILDAPLSKKQSRGNQELLEVIEKYKIPVHLFGHAHNVGGSFVEKNGTLFCNAAQHGEHSNPSQFGKVVTFNVYLPEKSSEVQKTYYFSGIDNTIGFNKKSEGKIVKLANGEFKVPKGVKDSVTGPYIRLPINTAFKATFLVSLALPLDLGGIAKDLPIVDLEIRDNASGTTYASRTLLAAEMMEHRSFTLPFISRPVDQEAKYEFRIKSKGVVEIVVSGVEVKQFETRTH